MPSLPTFPILLCSVLLVIAVSPTLAALSAGEKAALAQLGKAFPALSNVQVDANLRSEMDGERSSWPKDFSSVCLGPDGYDIHGVRCFSGHIDTIY